MHRFTCFWKTVTDIQNYNAFVCLHCGIFYSLSICTYFGIYDIFAKGASFLGSLVIASVKLAGGTINVAVATMAIFFAVGFVFLRLADKYDAPRHENN